MSEHDPEQRIDIRDRLRAHDTRQLVIARMAMPDDWRSELRFALAQYRQPSAIFGNDDLRLFLQSFAIFFTATMMFLI